MREHAQITERDKEVKRRGGKKRRNEDKITEEKVETERAFIHAE